MRVQPILGSLTSTEKVKSTTKDREGRKMASQNPLFCLYSVHSLPWLYSGMQITCFKAREAGFEIGFSLGLRPHQRRLQISLRLKRFERMRCVHMHHMYEC